MTRRTARMRVHKGHRRPRDNMQVRRQAFLTWCLAASALHGAVSQSQGRPPLAPPPGFRGGGPSSPEGAAGGRDLLSEGLNIPLLWGSPASIQIPALMLLTVVLIFFSAVARDSYLSLFEAPAVPPGHDLRDIWRRIRDRETPASSYPSYPSYPRPHTPPVILPVL
ncbi:hypothetical protein C7M84_008184 [Penaeus vannamei]|uniref:Uncharacterized protein n=1 Tax=Penaeus vannamei TaxID=6689 RepID=A0A423TAD1_PENVA|nr:hypothetical protein C7M84_008184 [Penaeus vannamei]